VVLADWHLSACDGRLAAVADAGPSQTAIPPQAQEAWSELADVLAATGPAACAIGDPEQWWPIRGASRDKYADAVAACRVCPARVACLAYAVAAGERHGIWGGLLPRERLQLARPDAA
jgi:WhiB family transcriptional regulator, redox-sensing transcriptional regulator